MFLEIEIFIKKKKILLLLMIIIIIIIKLSNCGVCTIY